MSVLLEFSFVSGDKDDADRVASNLRDALAEHGAHYFGSDDDGEQHTIRFIFDDEDEADAALAAIDTTRFEVRRSETRIEMVDLKDVKPGPIRHEALPDELAALARFSYQRIGNRMYAAYEQWELGFLRDMHPAGEIALWVRMAFAMERYVASHPDEDEDAVFKDLLSLLVGSAGGTPRQEELKSLVEAFSEGDFEEAVRLGT